MRELKFRAWNNYEKKMLYFGLFDDGGGFYGMPDSLRATKNELELMQFTGLHDCKGKEIYEGDILNCAYGKNLRANTINIHL